MDRFFGGAASRRWAPWVVGALLGGAAVIVSAGWRSPGRSPRIVEAEGFVLRDAEGRARALLGVAPDGSPALTLLDAAGRSQASLNGSADRSAMLNLGGRGAGRIDLAAHAGGTAALHMSGPDGRGGANLYLQADGRSALAFGAGEGVSQVGSPADRSAGLAVFDASGKEVGRIFPGPPPAAAAGPGAPSAAGPTSIGLRGDLRPAAPTET